ncbi:MAG: hypothetical protein M3Y51_06275 [Actinomycetota bacterium]|nr:hypothetical protein [Actinomycetota bacterium]
MRHTRNGRSARIGATVAALAAMSLLGGACTGDDGGVQLVAGELGDDADRAMLAGDNAYGAAGGRLDGVQGDNGYLEVEYFEALRKGEWVAPDHCWFSTRVSVSDTLVSDGFDGPSSDADVEAGDGLLVGSMTSSIPVALPNETTETTETTLADQPLPDEPSHAPDLLPPDTTTPADNVGTGHVTPDTSDTPGTTDTPDTPDTTVVWEDPPLEEWTEQPAILAIAVVYGHDQVVELSSADPSVIEGHGLESQPLDGWNLLRVALDPDTAPADGVDATLRRVHEDGTETSEQVRIPLGGDGLELRTDEWRFDLSKVDGSCAVPNGQVDNTPMPGETDIFGSPVGDAPTLPPPGEQPADPTAAADQALASLRAVYDLANVYAADKREHVEDPDAYDKVRRALIANDVVAPYMSQLDPQFRSAVFVSPTEAHILYRVGPGYQWEIGRVLLIDDSWRVASGTYCRDLAAAGYSCPGVVKDPPPGPLG